MTFCLRIRKNDYNVSDLVDFCPYSERWDDVHRGIILDKDGPHCWIIDIADSRKWWVHVDNIMEVYI